MGSWGKSEHEWVRAAAVAVLYYFSALIGQALALPFSPVSALWLPNALLIGVLLMTPRRRWWMYLLAILPVHLFAQFPLPDVSAKPAALQYLVNCAIALIGALAFALAPHRTYHTAIRN